MSENLKLTTQEYVEKKLSAFTPGPSVKEITSNDGSITVTPGADGKVDLHADKGLTPPIKADGHVIIPNTKAFIGPVDYSGYIAVGDNGSIAIKSNRGIEIGSDTTFVVGPGEHVYLHGTELTNGGGGQDYSNQIWNVFNDRYFGDQNLGHVHFRGDSGVYVEWDNKSVISATTQEGAVLGVRSGLYDTTLVSANNLFIRPTYSSYPSVGLNIRANYQSTYISGPVKFNEIYDKHGTEITASGGSSYSYISEDNETGYCISFGGNGCQSVFIDGPTLYAHKIVGYDIVGGTNGYNTFSIGAHESSPRLNFDTDNGNLRIRPSYNSLYISGPIWFNDGPVYFNQSIYDKYGTEIGPNKYIEENIDNLPALSVGRGPKGTIDSVFICGPCVSIGDSTYGYVGSTVYINGPTIIEISDNNGSVRLDLDRLKLQKLKDLLES